MKGTLMNLEIRHETEDEHFIVEQLTREAFWNLYVPGCDEHYLVHRMRSHEDYVPELSYIAVKNGNIVRSIMYTRSFIENEEKERIRTLSFGPVCVHPDHQRQGIGSALIEHTRKIAEGMGFPAIIILGDPHNYCKHGFRNGVDLNISMHGGMQPLGLLVLEMNGSIGRNGKYEYKGSEVYTLDPEEVMEFDRRFPFREKKHHYSQDLFSMMLRSHVEKST